MSVVIEMVRWCKGLSHVCMSVVIENGWCGVRVITCMYVSGYRKWYDGVKGYHMYVCQWL